MDTNGNVSDSCRHSVRSGGLLMVLPALLVAPMASPTPPNYSADELRPLVGWTALYPDPLLAQVLMAATYPADIDAAARWADEHHYLTGRELAEAIRLDSLPFAPSVQALLPFEGILRRMAAHNRRTAALGEAFLSDPGRVMDVVQELRRVAWDFGYLSSRAGLSVTEGDAVEVRPLDPLLIPLPTYQPRRVFALPTPGLSAAEGFKCDSVVRLGGWFEPWGWGSIRWAWNDHTLFLAGAPWARTWANRDRYIQPHLPLPNAGPRAPERHRLEPRRTLTPATGGAAAGAVSTARTGYDPGGAHVLESDGHYGDDTAGRD